MPTKTPGYEARFDLLGWDLLRRVLRLKRTLPRMPPTLVDLGMGRGRDLMYFSRQGFRVFGIDLSPAEVEKARRRAARYQIPVHPQLGDIRTLHLNRQYDVVYSNCALNNLPRGIRPERFAHFQAATSPGGIHAVNAFIARSQLWPPPDREPTESAFRSGELSVYYRKWSLISSREVTFDCAATGLAHQHALDVIIARKPG